MADEENKEVFDYSDSPKSTKKNILIMILIFIFIPMVLVGGFWIYIELSYNKILTEGRVLLTDKEIRSIGLYLGDFGYKISENPGGPNFLYKNYTTGHYDIKLNKKDVVEYDLIIDEYKFDSIEKRDEVYNIYYGDYEDIKEWESKIDENFIGDKSFLMKTFDVLVLGFVFEDYFIRIEAEQEIGEDKMREMADFMDRKIFLYKYEELNG